MSQFDPHVRAILLRAARDAIASHLSGCSPSFEADCGLIDLPSSGVFVTLRKSQRLRGCIGTFDAGARLIDTIRRIAVSAAHDPRFAGIPISAAELKDISIELSILSPLRVILDPLDFVLGVHGIFVRKGHHTGCFLPDVALERNWSREDFLSECCAQKADLEPGAWMDADTEVSVFTVEKICDP